MTDVSGFGISITIFADQTFPGGLTLSQFADDSDPLDIPSMQVGDSGMGVNGNLVTWSKANPKKLTLSMVPGTEDDDNMQVLLMNNTPVRGKALVKDEITMVINYPNGRTLTASTGAITDGILGDAVSASHRMKTKPYIFVFEDMDWS